MAPRLPDQTRPSQVHLRAGHLEKALAFYASVLGFQVSRQRGSRVWLSAGGTGLAFLVLTEDRNAAPRPARATGLYHFAIRYPERRALAQALLRLARNKYPIEGASDHIVSEAIYLSDPDHNGVELYVDRPRTQWVWHDGQVQMSTEALDLENLLSSAGGETDLAPPPPQTDLGHIHLHVANLKKAESFYHDLMGFAVTQRSYPGALFFAADGYHHHIATNTWAGGARPPEGSVGLISYRLEVPDGQTIAALRERAASGGIEARMNADSEEQVLQIRDPNGNWMEVAATSAK
jgi:catechol 2,3-dioxygenase